MEGSTARKHTCFRCTLHEGEIPGRNGVRSEEAALESLETTFCDNSKEVFFASGYSAREIAQKRAREIDGAVYVNTVSRRIKQPDLTMPVSYAVAKSPVYTLRAQDDLHERLYRSYWRPL